MKLLFEDAYRILVHFPSAGEPLALTFSDVDRSPKVTARFTDLLRAHLHVEVAPKALRGTELPARRRPTPPRKHAARWWAGALAPRTDDPCGASSPH